MGKEECGFTPVPEPVRDTNCWFEEDLEKFYDKWNKITGKSYAYLE